MKGSSLVTYTCESPNHSVGRSGNKIWIFTPHCVVGQCTVQSLGNVFLPRSRQASSTYGIGYDGRIAQYVDEADRPWTTSSKWNDDRAITVEVASDTCHPYRMNQAAYDSLVRLGADICIRYGFKRVIWPGSLKALQGTAWPNDAMLLSAHRWYAATACPGDWLYSREAQLATDITNMIEEMRDLTKAETRALIEELVPGIVNGILSGRAESRQTAEVPAWAVDELEAARGHGITDGSRPNDLCTRLEAALMADRALTKAKINS